MKVASSSVEVSGLLDTDIVEIWWNWGVKIWNSTEIWIWMVDKLEKALWREHYVVQNGSYRKE